MKAVDSYPSAFNQQFCTAWGHSADVPQPWNGRVWYDILAYVFLHTKNNVTWLTLIGCYDVFLMRYR